MTWVVSDYTATPGTSEVSVTKGQQVEILETSCSGAPDFCLVRLSPIGGGDGGTQEGLVPVAVLKPAPNGKGFSTRGRTLDVAEKEQPETTSGKCLFNQYIIPYIYI